MIRFSHADVLDSLNLGIIIVDDAGKVLLWNRWIETYSNVSCIQAEGLTLNEIFQEPLDPALLRAIDSVLDYGTSVVLSTALHRWPLPLYDVNHPDNGTRLYQSVTVSSLKTAKGENGCLIQITDSSNSIRRENILRTYSENLKRQAITDALTGIYNRRFFDDSYIRALGDARRRKHLLSIFMIDIDYFKSYNDYYGHLSGDDVIKKIAHALRSQISRATDTLARYGGEEFVLILPDSSEKNAPLFAEKLKNAVFKLNIPHEKSLVSDRISISIGICTGDSESGDLLKKADVALYQAKESGRNRYIALP